MNPNFQMIVFASIMTTLVGLVHYYLWRRLIRDTKIPKPWRKLLTVLLIFFAICLPGVMILSHSMSPSEIRWLLFAPFVWMGVMLLLFVSTLIADVFKLSVWVADKAGPKPVNSDRRLFLTRLAAGSAVLTTGSLSGAAVLKGKAFPIVKRVEVKLSLFPEALNGYRIVLLTDLHIGGTLDSVWLQKVVERTNELSPNLIVITGDMVDAPPHMLLHEMQSLSLLNAENGVFFVTGNHEYYAGAEEWIPAIESLGIRVLRNEHSIIRKGDSSFALLGVDDFNASRILPDHGSDLNKACKGIPPNTETILLAHQPRQIFEAAQKNLGLQLSGHTHGGQIWPITHFVPLQQPYNKGLFSHPGSRTQVYVSQGTGYWGPPMRLGTENEISEIIVSKG